ncbi:hypothetical protein MJT46_007313 [Ovis ammon polii x Ovis aries]|nr:hypothetical protein MJT46_007313 [Ovis ammon polii x Ovis aries]
MDTNLSNSLILVHAVPWKDCAIGTDYSTDDWMCKDREPGEQWQSTCFHRKDDSVMHPWVAILGFLLLLPDGVTSYRQVIGVEGQSVTLPCFYEGKVTSICWGRGRCSWIDCRNTVISTDGYKVTEQKNERYKLKGDIGLYSLDVRFVCLFCDGESSNYNNNHYSNNDHHYYYSKKNDHDYYTSKRNNRGYYSNNDRN